MCATLTRCLRGTKSPSGHIGLGSSFRERDRAAGRLDNIPRRSLPRSPCLVDAFPDSPPPAGSPRPYRDCAVRGCGNRSLEDLASRCAHADLGRLFDASVQFASKIRRTTCGREWPGRRATDKQKRKQKSAHQSRSTVAWLNRWRADAVLTRNRQIDDYVFYRNLLGPPGRSTSRTAPSRLTKCRPAPEPSQAQAQAQRPLPPLKPSNRWRRHQQLSLGLRSRANGTVVARWLGLLQRPMLHQLPYPHISCTERSKIVRLDRHLEHFGERQTGVLEHCADLGGELLAALAPS